MFVKIILFVVVAGLHDALHHGKVCGTEPTEEKHGLPEILGESFIGPLVNPKFNQKRDSNKSWFAQEEKNRVGLLRSFTVTIQRYLSAIKDTIDGLERELLQDFDPYDKQNRKFNDRDDNFGGEVSPSQKVEVAEPLWKVPGNEFILYPMQTEDDGKKLASDRERGLLPSKETKVEKPPGLKSDRDSGEKVDPSFQDVDSYKNSDKLKPFKPNIGPFESDDDFMDVDEEDMKKNLCEGCGNPDGVCDSDKRMKPLVINIKSDCFPDRLINRFFPQSRAHCRPFNMNPCSNQLSKFPSCNYRNSPRFYYD